MPNETAEQIRRDHCYIEHALAGVSIHGWGGPFLLFTRSAGQAVPMVYLPRNFCSLLVDPFEGRTECQELGIFPNRQAAEAAVRASRMASVPNTVVYSHYFAARNLILPTIVCRTTAPRLTSAMLAAANVEVRHAAQASNLVIDVFLTLGTMTVAVATARSNGPRPPLPPGAPAVAAAPRGVISVTDMLAYVLDVYRRTPLLQELRRLHLSGEINMMEVRRILAEFSRQSGVRVQVVRTGEVSSVRGVGNFASLNIQPGILMIEEQVQVTPRRFLDEIIHEISHFYAGGRNEPLLANRVSKATGFIEQLIREGEAPVRHILQLLA